MTFFSQKILISERNDGGPPPPSSTFSKIKFFGKKVDTWAKSIDDVSILKLNLQFFKINSSLEFWAKSKKKWKLLKFCIFFNNFMTIWCTTFEILDIEKNWKKHEKHYFRFPKVLTSIKLVTFKKTSFESMIPFCVSLSSL